MSAVQISLKDTTQLPEELPKPHLTLLRVWETLDGLGVLPLSDSVIDRCAEYEVGDWLSVVAVENATSFPVMRHAAVGIHVQQLHGQLLHHRRIGDSKRTDGYSAFLTGTHKLAMDERRPIMTNTRFIHEETGDTCLLQQIICPCAEAENATRETVPTILISSTVLSVPNPGTTVLLRQLRMEAGDIAIIHPRAAAD